MRSLCVLTTIVLSLAAGTVTAASPQWERFTVPGTGAAAEIPVSILDKGSDLPDGGVGRRFYTDDRRADLTVQSVANPGNDSPATFLAKKKPPPGILYKIELLRCVQRAHRSDLVQSLQSIGRLHELYLDQLSACRKASVG